MKRVQQHPSTTRVFQDAARRFMELREENRIAGQRMWAGTLAANFTPFELVLIADYLSPNDHALLRSVRKAIGEPETPTP